MSATIPQSHHDLLDNPVIVVLATVMPNGQPQVTPVWCNRHGNQVWVNSAIGRQKDKNMRSRPFATVTAIDPKNPYRWIEVRGKVVEMVEGEEAVAHIDSLSQLYLNRPKYRGMSPTEKRCIYKIEPTHIVVNG